MEGAVTGDAFNSAIVTKHTTAQGQPLIVYKTIYVTEWSSAFYRLYISQYFYFQYKKNIFSFKYK